MKLNRDRLKASNQRLSEECNRHDQDGKEKNRKKDGCQPTSTTEQLLQLAVSRVASNSNGQPPGDHGDKGFQNKEASRGKQDDKGKVNENFESATQVRLIGCRLARGHVGFSFADQARLLYDCSVALERHLTPFTIQHWPPRNRFTYLLRCGEGAT